MEQQYGTQIISNNCNNNLSKDISAVAVALNGVELTANAINERIDEVDEELDEDDKDQGGSEGKLTITITVPEGKRKRLHSLLIIEKVFDFFFSFSN